MNNTIYTIGHSTHSAQTLIDLLTRYDITAVADVRSHPYSRMNPQFNKKGFQRDLKTAGIAYVFLGRELGARSEDRSCYVNGKVQYDLLAQTVLFQEGLDRLCQGMNTHRIALVCAEQDPLTCHRAILVCRHLVARGVAAQHILKDGRLESHDEALKRLLAELGLPEHDLFRARDEVMAEAYLRRGQQIAYTERELSDKTPVRRVEA
jgi:uncharacterized protein (DUF488 family)